MDKINALLAKLDGYKTLAFSIAGLVIVALWLLGVVSSDVAERLLAMLGFGGLAALRHGLMKIEKAAGTR